MPRHGAAVLRCERRHCVGASSRPCPDAQNAPLECPQTLLTVFLISPCEHVGHDEEKKARDYCGEDHVMHPTGPASPTTPQPPVAFPGKAARPARIRNFRVSICRLCASAQAECMINGCGVGDLGSEATIAPSRSRARSRTRKKPSRSTTRA